MMRVVNAILSFVVGLTSAVLLLGLRLVGALLRFKPVFFVALIAGGAALWYGLTNWTSQGRQAPQVGPGQYMPSTASILAPSTPPQGAASAPAASVVLPPITRGPAQVPTIQAEPIPGLADIAPPPPGPPPLPEAPFGFVRGYRPPVTDRP